MEEKMLVQRLKQGELAALENIYRNYSEKVLNQAYRILLSRKAAEDVLHDIFVRLPDSIRSFRGESAMQTWLYRITHNACLERLRTGKNRQRLLKIYRDRLQKSEGPSFEDRDLLSRALNFLDGETRSLIWLKEGEGLEVKELSHIFGMPEGTVKSRLARGREKLQKWLEKEATHAV